MSKDEMQPLQLSRKFIILTIFTVLVASCLSTPTTPAKTPKPPTTTVTTYTPSLSPTSTHTVDKILFLSTDQSTQFFSSDPLLSSLNQLAQSEGWEVLSTSSLSSEDIDPGTKLVVAVTLDPGLEELAREKPDVQFLAIGISGLTPSLNLSILGPGGFREDRIAFIAGYISAVLTKDWRIGLLNQASSESIEKVQGSFANGVTYYCGLCRLTYPPFHDYPILTVLPEEATEIDWETAAQFLISQSVETAFVYSNQLNLSTLDFLLENDFRLLGVQKPPDEYLNSWVTTIRNAPEQILETHWVDLISGKGGWVEEMPIVLDDINENLFSPGRQVWVQEVLHDLMNGYIVTGYAQEGDF